MKHKRLNRDLWGFSYYPYYQLRIDDPDFHGLACLIRLTDGEAFCWDLPLAGKTQVTGCGMTWLQLVPDGERRVITAICFPEGSRDPRLVRRTPPADPSFLPSVWYVDVIDGLSEDECGVAVFDDLFLDVIFTPEGDVRVDDRDELDEALANGEISAAQHGSAVREGSAIMRDLCADIPAAEAWCARIRRIVEERIARGEPVHPGREVLALGRDWDVRRITAADAGECARVIRESFLTVAHDFGITRENAPRFTAFAMTEDRLRGEIDDSRREVVACFDAHTGRIAGCCSLGFTEAGVCELNHLCVLPDHRHRRLGALLMREAFIRAYAHGCRRIILSLVEENTRLKRWYERFGFVAVGTRKFDHLPFSSGYMERPLF